MAAAVRLTGASLPAISAVLYTLSLMLVALGTWTVGRVLFRTTWGTIALLAAMTLRHAIARSGTNTIEGYFQPRQIAFGLGLIAVGAFLEGRLLLAAALVAAGAIFHPTAALWFAVWLSAAALCLPGRPRRVSWRRECAVLLGLWGVTAGPLAGRISTMDAEWLGTLAGKEYLFPLQWPAYAWALNLGYLAIILAVHRVRSRERLMSERERALAFGCYASPEVFALACCSHLSGRAGFSCSRRGCS